MATTPLKTLEIRPPKSPNQPIAPVAYDQRFQDQFSNALRLYFNEIDNFGAGILSSTGGANIQFPYIAASDSTDQYATATDTPTTVTWDTADSISGWTLNANGSASPERGGVYNIAYSLQFVNTDNAIHDATVWLEVNGDFVPKSASVFTLQARKSAGVYNYVVGYSSVVFEAQTGDEIALLWATNQAATSGGGLGIYIEHQPEQVSPYAHPSVPSAIGSITFVSRLPTAT